MKSVVRISNLELYRIIVMLFIIAHHYVVNSGLMDVLEQNPTSEHSISYYLMGMWGKTGINCLVLITGYFMCKSHITMRKFLKLLFQVEFYAIVIYLVFVVAKYEPFSWYSFLKVAWPFWQVHDNFASCFLLFYLFIPFLNVLIHGLSKRQHLQLMGLCLFVYTILGTIPDRFVWMNYITWFCILYLVSSYIRLYRIYRDDDVKFWGALSGISVFFSMLSVVIIIFLKSIYPMSVHPYLLVIDSNKILAFITSVCVFNWFRNIKVQKSYINSIASTTFGVFLIHTHSDTMRHFLWVDTANVVGHYQSSLLYAGGVILSVFVVCSILDAMRARCCEKYYMRLVDLVLNRWGFE